MKCHCEDWKNDAGLLSAATIHMQTEHGIERFKLLKPFKYCPYCGSELFEVIEITGIADTYKFYKKVCFSQVCE